MYPGKGNCHDQRAGGSPPYDAPRGQPPANRKQGEHHEDQRERRQGGEVAPELGLPGQRDHAHREAEVERQEPLAAGGDKNSTGHREQAKGDQTAVERARAESAPTGFERNAELAVQLVQESGPEDLAGPRTLA